jgi:hypothetical protein
MLDTCHIFISLSYPAFTLNGALRQKRTEIIGPISLTP